MLAEEEFDVMADEPFGQAVGLDEEKPPEVARGELPVGAGVHGRGRGNVEDRHPFDGAGVVAGHAVRDPPAPVVPDDGEARVAELPHDLYLVEGHAPLGVGGLRLVGGGPAAVAVVAQVGGDHGETFGQPRGNGVPGGRGLRVAVHEQHGRPATRRVDGVHHAVADRD